MTKKFNHYLGKAGHLTVMSEFLMLGWNVAIPEVDIGDDIFVVKDADGILKKVQVKTSQSINRKSGYGAQFSVSYKNLLSLRTPLAYYVFIVRHNNEWSKPLVIKQDYLEAHYRKYMEKKGDKATGFTEGNIIFYISFQGGKVKCNKQDFSIYINDFSDFPQINH